MSAGTPSGAVSIQFIGDFSQVDSEIAKRSKGYTFPARAEYIGPTGQSAGASGGPVYTAGPATFGNLGGAPSAPAGFVGPSSFNFSSGPAGGGYSAAGIAGSSGANLSDVTRQLGTAAAALSSAAQALAQSSSRLAGGGGGAPSYEASPTDRLMSNEYRRLYNGTVETLQGPAMPGRGPAGPTGGGPAGRSRVFGLNAGGLARYATAGFIAREAASLLMDESHYRMSERLAAGDPMARSKLSAEHYIQLEGSFLGVGYISAAIRGGPSPEEILMTGGDVEHANRLIGMRESDLSKHRQLAGLARASDYTGPTRARQEVENQYQEQRQDIIHRRAARITAADEERQRAIDKANDAYDKANPTILGVRVQTQVNGHGVQGDTSKARDRAIAGANADFENSRQAIGREFEPDFAAIDKLRKSSLAQITRQDLSSRYGAIGSERSD